LTHFEAGARLANHGDDPDFDWERPQAA
jgi:hypothetical protein